MENQRIEYISCEPCESCGEYYDRTEESEEIKQSGSFFCKKCWDEE